MPSFRKFLSILVLICAAAFATSRPGVAQQDEARFALVVGDDGYEVALPTAANDAGLVADTLRAAGFEVTGARNLDGETLRSAVKEFSEKVAAAGPTAVAFVYLSGYGVQYNGENYFVPVGVDLPTAADVTGGAIRLAEIAGPLEALPAKLRIIVLDAARPNPFAGTTAELAGGLALVEPADGELIAFNAAPGTVAPLEAGPYGAYASALAEMIRTGGLPLDEVFERVRLRVSQATNGAVVPWNTAKLNTPFVFLEVAPGASRPVVADQSAALMRRPIRDFPEQEAYSAALARDTFPGYSDFVAAYPNSPYARRVNAILAARREGLTWQRSASVNTPSAYWSYLRRYPRGAHAHDARRRLTLLTAAFEPPPDFAPIDYRDIPPPPPREIVYVERPVLVFDGPDFAPPPPPPPIFLPPPPAWWAPPPPPPPVFAPYFLPAPRPFIAPVFLAPPPSVRPPPPPPVFVLRGGPGPRPGPEVGPGLAGASAAAAGVMLPQVLRQRVQVQNNIVIVNQPTATPGQRPILPGQPIPGVHAVAVPVALVPRLPPGPRPVPGLVAPGRPSVPAIPATTGPVPPGLVRPPATALPTGGALPAGTELPPAVTAPVGTPPRRGPKPGPLPGGPTPVAPTLTGPATTPAVGTELPTGGPAPVGTPPRRGHKPGALPGDLTPVAPTVAVPATTPAVGTELPSPGPAPVGTPPRRGHKPGVLPGAPTPVSPTVAVPAATPVVRRAPAAAGGATPKDTVGVGPATTPAVVKPAGPAEPSLRKAPPAKIVPPPATLAPKPTVPAVERVAPAKAAPPKVAPAAPAKVDAAPAKAPPAVPPSAHIPPKGPPRDCGHPGQPACH